jgi:hypothetical protein
MRGLRLVLACFLTGVFGEFYSQNGGFLVGHCALGLPALAGYEGG